MVMLPWQGRNTGYTPQWAAGKFHCKLVAFNRPTLRPMAVTLTRPMLRDPVEHAVWNCYYPVIADWLQRPYFKDVAYGLLFPAAGRLYPAADERQQAVRDRLWRRAEARFMAMTEHRSVGAIGNKLAEHGDEEGAKRVRSMAAVVEATIAAAKRREEAMRAGIKEVLAASGVSTLLNDERYEPVRWSWDEQLGDSPVPFTCPQLTIIGSATLAVKDLYAPMGKHDGLRIVLDMYPPARHGSQCNRYDVRIKDGQPSRRLFDWFGHIPERWPEFQHYHHRQLHAKQGTMLSVLRLLSKGPATLLHLKRGEYSIARSLFNYLLDHYPEVSQRGE